MGAYPQKALGVLRSVATRMEEWVRDEKYGAVVLPQIGETSDGQISEEVTSDRRHAKAPVAV
jgi:pyruvate kinase